MKYKYYPIDFNPIKVIMVRPPASDNFIENVLKLKTLFSNKDTSRAIIWEREITFKGAITQRMIIWDFAWAVQFRRVFQRYLSNTLGAIFIVNLWEMETYELVVKYYSFIKKFSGFIPFMLIGRLSSSKDTVGLIRENVIQFCNLKGGAYIEISPEVYTDMKPSFETFSKVIFNNFEELLK